MPKSEEKWEKVGVIGVDAGLCWVGDPCYIIKDPGEERYKELGKDWQEFCEILHNKEQLDSAKNVAGFNYDKGHAGLGVCVSSGLGDGLYEVFVKRVKLPGWGNRIAALKVVFIEDDDFEETPTEGE